jgi:hypothetical protein
MISDLFEVGDLVKITILKENREWGYNPCPDGTLAKIRSFQTIDYGYTNNFGHQPGVYLNKCWANFQIEGKDICLSHCHYEMVDVQEYEHRLEKFRARQKSHPDDWDIKERISDLPETALWPGDKVISKNVWDTLHPMLFVAYVRYDLIDQKRVDGSPMPIYDVSEKYPPTSTSPRGDKDLSLIQRGNVWNFYHHLPLDPFSSLEEEAQFFSSLGRTCSVRNPANGIYSWHKDEVLDAIETGLVHGFRVSAGWFGGNPSTEAIRFLDEDLGRRVAAATLKGFGRT